MQWIESENLELKKSTGELKAGIVSLVAMLNKHHRGELWFGIKTEGTVVGQSISDASLREVSKSIGDHIEPKVYPSVEKVMLDGKPCIRVQVEGKEAPYYAYGRAYIRVGDEDRQVSAREPENFILEKNRDRLRWDMDICPQATQDDISSTKLKRFLTSCGLKYDTAQNALDKLNLLKKHKILNAAVLCFGKKPEKFFANAKLRCATFGTTDTTVTLDMKDIVGDVFTLIEKAEKYILEHINIGMRVEGLLRVDVPEIDREAFREAIINAFCHRDYREYDSVNIAVFKDRIEIRNPGLLYGGLTVSDIREKMVSLRRNELLAELFQRRHLIEKWGRGIKLILAKEPATEFEEVGSMLFVARFWRKELQKNVTVKTEATSKESSGKSSGKTENQVLSLLSGKPEMTIPELAETLKITTRGIEKQIAKLRREGRLRRIGPAKGGHWEINKN
ncbi:MAG: putative DNA binding domain-containing protein [Deltaproteobacteria bacterium]|jgi:ATP-dependent DNA helicase RecG